MGRTQRVLPRTNRRLVRNAFAIVEQVAEHTWDSFGALLPPNAVDPSIADKVERALARLRALGSSATRRWRGQAEHESWSNYLRHWGCRRHPAR